MKTFVFCGRKDIETPIVLNDIEIYVEALGNYRKVVSQSEFFTLASLKICEINKDKETIKEAVKQPETKAVVQQQVSRETQKETIETKPIIEHKNFNNEIINSTLTSNLIASSSFTRPASRLAALGKLII